MRAEIKEPIERHGLAFNHTYAARFYFSEGFGATAATFFFGCSERPAMWWPGETGVSKEHGLPLREGILCLCEDEMSKLGEGVCDQWFRVSELRAGGPLVSN